MGKTYTYNPKQVKIALGSHVVTGYADDSFVTIDPLGDGTTLKIGCDGEANRAISVNNSFSIKLSLLQSSETNEFLRNRLKKDQSDGDGTFPITVKDLMGKELFTSDAAWVTKEPTWTRGKETNNREWELQCGEGRFDNE